MTSGGNPYLPKDSGRYAERPVEPGPRPEAPPAKAAPIELKAWEHKPKFGSPGPGISLAELAKLELPEPKWGVEGYLPEGLTVFGGKPKAGKSLVALLMAWAVASGKSFYGRKVLQGDVLYLGLEDSMRLVQDRTRAMRTEHGWDFPDNFTLHTVWPKVDDGGLYYIAEWLTAHKGTARMVVVDVLAKYRKPQKGSGNSYADDYEAVGGLRDLLILHNVCGVMLHHTRKLKAEDPFDELSGTLAISGAADSLWVLDSNANDQTGRLWTRGRDLPATTTDLKHNPATFLWTFGAARGGIDTDGRGVVGADGGGAVSKAQACKAWLKDFLREFAYPSKEIEAAAKAAGFTFTALRDAKTQLGKTGSGELVNRNFGGGGKDQEWWCGLASAESWQMRPAPLDTDNPDSRTHGGTDPRRHRRDLDGPPDRDEGGF